MAVYFVVDIKVHDPQLYEDYRKQVGATLEKYGGKFLIRGGAFEVIEGEWPLQRLVMLEFADTAQFKRWYSSPEYSRIREIRFQASDARAILVQGVD
ncbi:DUF1330 domain-containing protein [Dictyobacter kobayashii]|uniref:DUF1330 domain-containing protein n=1 Tax=Dictyobacter kobayashii TaxID=2014872 RepID=A0A402ACP3_9CHLR|nr:DUF1330 domain-containing protein [Dictyobacter kobayashii]GCE16863.1 hypothetical protein KDK_06630 [Dictyobacter kobayashii]